MSNSVTTLIVDDENLARVNLAMALKEYGHWKVLAEVGSAAAARDFLQQHTVDVVFLDIQMPEQTGIDLARFLCQLSTPPLVIFVTAYNNYAMEAFEVHALDYLLKPFDDSRLAQALQRAESLIAQRAHGDYVQALRNYIADDDQSKQNNATNYLRQVSVRSIGRIEVIALTEVQWISSAGNYVELHLPQRVVLHRIPMGQLEARLDPADFIRVHRSAIVARSQLRSLHVTGDGTYDVELKNGDNAPVSERYIDDLRQLFETK